jgi:putative endonuclease
MEQRLHRHRMGEGAAHTSARLPVDLVYQESCASIEHARSRERQLKRWSGDKKTALIKGDFAELKRLSKRRRPKPAKTVWPSSQES